MIMMSETKVGLAFAREKMRSGGSLRCALLSMCLQPSLHVLQTLGSSKREPEVIGAMRSLIRLHETCSKSLRTPNEQRTPRTKVA